MPGLFIHLVCRIYLVCVCDVSGKLILPYLDKTVSASCFQDFGASGNIQIGRHRVTLQSPSSPNIALAGNWTHPGYTSGCQEKQFPKGVHISPSNDQAYMKAQEAAIRTVGSSGVTFFLACDPVPWLANVDDFTSFDGQVRSLGECQRYVSKHACIEI